MKMELKKKDVKKMIKKSDKVAVKKDKMQDKKMMGNTLMKKCKEDKY